MMITNPAAVHGELRRRVLWGYDPRYDWASCCASSVNYLVLSEAEFHRVKARAMAERAAARPSRVPRRQFARLCAAAA